MTTERNVEPMLRRWLVDGVDEMPERVYLSILDRVERQPQQRAWRVSWRDSTVNTYLKPLLAIAAIVVVAVAGFAILRPSNATVGGPATAAPSPSQAVAASPSPTPPWDNAASGPCGDQGCAGPLTPGAHASEWFRPSVSYTITEPWVNLRDFAGFFQLYPDTTANRTLAAAGEYAPYILILTDPVISPSGTCPEYDATDQTKVDAAAFAEYIATRDDLVKTDPIPVTLGGLSGLQVDLGLASGTTGCIPGAPAGEAPSAGDRYRVIVLDRPDAGSLMIRLSATPSDFDAFMTDAMPVVNSFEFDLTPVPSPS
jgi:hypothetical protein